MSSAAASGGRGTLGVVASPTVGTQIEVFWQPEDAFFSGTVTKVWVKDNKHEVTYDDGDVEKLDLAKERWRLKQAANGVHDDDAEGSADPEVKANPKEAPNVGANIEVYWPVDKVYYPGIIKSYIKKTKKHQIDYEDGQSEKLVLDEETWRYPPAADMADEDEEDDASEEEEEEVREVKVGDAVEIYWPEDEVYYPGKIGKFDSKTGKHTIKYDDNEEEHLVLKNEKWRFSESKKEEAKPASSKKRGRPTAVTKASAKPLGGKANKKKRT